LILQPVNISNGEFIIFVAISSLMLWVSRHLLHAVIFTYFPAYFHENVLILGLPNSSEFYHADTRHKFGKNLNIVGFIHADNKSFGADRNYSGHIDDLDQIVNDFNIKRLIVTGEFNDLPPGKLIERTSALNITCSFITHTPLRSTNHINITTLPELSIAGWNRLQLMAFNWIKRLMDILVTIPLIILHLPFAIIIGILIKLDDSGPVLFVQERVGRHGTKFRFFKYRTMSIDTDAYAVSPGSQEDPRITRIGRYLRKLSLDELPQLINVLKGDMSLIGPRPEMPFIVEGYDSVINQRHLVKPGITGIWQISAGREHPIHDHIEYDFFYIENMSLTLDIIIIMITFRFIFKGLTA
ncbi:MAG: exopolysaccharide biosynthesis polyprenyl glycosylphosphotransferase, partial [Candidatus Neomarinimicrobiota bacterium]